MWLALNGLAAVEELKKYLCKMWELYPDPCSWRNAENE